MTFANISYYVLMCVCSSILVSIFLGLFYLNRPVRLARLPIRFLDLELGLSRIEPVPLVTLQLGKEVFVVKNPGKETHPLVLGIRIDN